MSSHRFPKKASAGVLLGLTARVAAAGTAVGVVVVFTVAAQATGFLLALPPALLLVAAAFVPYQGMTVAEWAPTLVHWHARKAAGQTKYLSRFESRPSGTCGLGGDAAALRYLVDTTTGAAYIHDPHRRTLTGVIEVSHPAFVLLDPADQDDRVSRWDRVMAAISHSGTVAALQVLEAVIPERGDGPAEWYAAHGVHDGGWADQQYTILLAQTRLQAATHRTTVSLALDMAAAARSIKAAGGGTSGAAAVLRQDLALLGEELRQSGIGVHHVLTEAELAAICRNAYDPAVTLDPRCDPGANLAHAGPMFIDEHKDCLELDSGWATVLHITEWPRVEVAADFLHGLLFADAQRTFSLIARPLPTIESLRQIRKEKVGGLVDARQKARIGQVDDYGDTQERNDVLAREMAVHHGHVDMEFLGLVTVTAATRDALEASVQRIVRAAGSSFCETRPVVGRQAQSFVLGALPFARTATRGGFKR